MIFFGTRTLTRREDTGEFECPRCGCARNFTLHRVRSYFHIYWIPLFREGIVAEYVRCDSCQHDFPINVLASCAPQVDSPFAAGAATGDSVVDCIGNVVDLTETAAEEMRRRICDAGFGVDVVVRIAPEGSRGLEYRVAFDYATADGQDWLGHSQGLPIAVDKRDAAALHGKVIDFRHGEFCGAQQR